MPKNNAKLKIDIQKSTELRLIDSKVLRTKKMNAFRKVLIFIAAWVVLIGGGVIGYTLFSEKTAQEPAPEIVVPPSPPPAPEASANPPQPVVIRQVTILDTPVGYLNVRKGPGTNFEKIGQVKPGETYDLVSENPEKTWYEIKFTSTTGWVIKEYAREK